MSRVLFERRLVAHPDTPVGALDLGVTVSRLRPNVLAIEYGLTGTLRDIALPAPETPRRRDGLWKRTCFEAFVGGPDAGYVEWNFAPSRGWAAYRFDRYRDGMRPIIDLRQPIIATEHVANDRFALTAIVDLAPLPGAGAVYLGLSAVIEKSDGTMSYWALRHPPGAPDFHHPDCFALELPAVASP